MSRECPWMPIFDADDWTTEPFLQIFSDKTGGQTKIKKSDYRASGVLPIIDQGSDYIGGYTNNLQTRSCVKLPCILFGDHTRLFKYVDKPFAIGADGVKVLEVREDIHPRYAYYFLNRVRLPDNTGYRHYKYLKRTTFCHPSFEEQRRIATILDKADAVRRKRQESIRLTEEFLKSVFLDMFGDPVTNPKGWDISSFEEQIVSIRYGTGSPPPYVENGIPFIRATNVKKGTILDKNMCYISKEEATRISKCKIKSGDLIIVRSGVNSGDCGLIPPRYDDAYAAYDMIIELPFVKAIFYNYLINSKYGKNVISPLKRRAGQPHLNAKQVRSLRFIKPSSESMNKYALLRHEVFALLSQMKDDNKYLEMLFNSLVQRVFKGEL